MLSRTVVLALAAFALPAWAAPAQETVREASNGEFLFKHYPPRALAAREEGQVGFQVSLGSDGSLKSCEVTKSSGFSSLDKETCELIVRYAHFKPVKDAEGRNASAVQSGHVNWKLPPNAPAMATRPGTRSASLDSERLVCRKDRATGSLVVRTKQCMTAREWARSTAQTRQRLDEWQGGGGSWEGKPAGEICGSRRC